jgi:hypothetical protein
MDLSTKYDGVVVVPSVVGIGRSAAAAGEYTHACTYVLVKSREMLDLFDSRGME